MKEIYMKNLVGLLLIAIMGLILLSGCSTPAVTTTNSKYTISGVSSALGDVPAVDFELSAALPDFPDKLQVYKMVKPEITREYVKNLGAKFGFAGELSEGTENYLLSDNETRTYLEVYKATGTFNYSEYPKLFPNSETVLQKAPVLPSDAEAMKIATDFLVERNLLPEGDVADKVEVGGKFGNIPLHLLVSFKHVVQIMGPGAMHAVRIGDGGEVVQVFINPTNPLVLPPLEIAAAKPIQQAYDEILTAKHYYAPSQSQKALIDNVTVAYWIEDKGIGQDYVAPVYVFRGQCLDRDGKQLDSPFIGVIEALK
jgi:hypothetical protein